MRHGDDTSITSLVWLMLRGMLPAVVVAAAAAAVVYVVSLGLPSVYTASATLFASSTNPSLVRFDVALAAPPPIDLVAYRSLATSQAVIDRARLLVNDPTLLDRAQVTATSEVMNLSSIIRISARADGPDAAAEVANGMARALVEWDRQRSKANLANVVRVLEEQVVAVADEIETLEAAAGADAERLGGAYAVLGERQQQLAFARALSASALGTLDIVESAVAPDGRIAPLPRSYAMIAFLGVLFVGFGLSLLLQALDSRVHSASEAARLTGLPVFAEFDRGGGASRVDQQALGFLRANLDLAVSGSKPAVVVFTSPRPLERRAYISAGVATTYAEDGHRTLLVDAGVETTALAGLFGLRRGASAARPLRAQRGAAGLDLVLGYGSDQADGERLRRGFMRSLAGWGERYDVVVVDAAPLLDAADVLVMAPTVSGVVLVVDLARATREQLRESTALLQRSPVPVIGVALIARSDRWRLVHRQRRAPRRSRRRRLPGLQHVVRRQQAEGS